MKAISLKQPWANFIRDGRKTIETRAWKTEYRGDLLICSSKNDDALEYFSSMFCDFDVAGLEINSEPKGMAIALQKNMM